MKLIIATLFCATFLTLPSLAQTANDIEDEVVVTGTVRGGDPAMGAFFSGDYATAKIEFGKNFRRLKRADMVEKSGISASASNSILAEVRSGPTQVGADGGGSNADMRQAAPNLSALAGRSQKSGEGILSGTDAGFQIYMVAMSELQLREYDMAIRNFEKALSLNKGLFDAHLRLGILYLRAGDKKSAQKQLKALSKFKKRCREICEEKIEIDNAHKLLTSILNRAGA